MSSPTFHGSSIYPSSSSEAYDSPPPMRGALARHGRGGHLRSQHGGHNQSRKWTSPEAKGRDEFRIVRNAMQRLFPRSEVAKMTEVQYQEHKRQFLADRAEELSAKASSNEHGPTLHIMPGFMDALIHEANFSAVLRQKTIWCVNWENGKDEIAPWPTFAEMRWEGDDRAKTDCKRFLGLPREEGHPQIHWQQLNVVPQYPLDEVARIPTMEDTHLPIEDIPVLRVFDFVNKDLLEDIDENNVYLWIHDYLDQAKEDDPRTWARLMKKLDLSNVPQY